MAKLTKTIFLNNFSSNPSLHKEVLKQGGVKWSELKNNPEDYYTANSGSVHGMIYYSDTVKFAKKHHLKILQILDEFENECGLLSNKPSPMDETQYFNWLSWFAWESMMSEFISFLD